MLVERRTIPSTFRRGPNDVAVLSGRALVRDMVEQALGTRGGDARRMGELPWDGDFGCRLDAVLHMAMTTDAGEFARAMVVSTLRQYVPAVRVVDVVTEPRRPDGDQPAALVIRVSFVHVPTNTQETVELSLG